MAYARAAENRVRKLAVRRSLRMRGTHRRVQRADDYGLYQLVDDSGQAVTPFWPLDRLEEFLIGLRCKWQGRAIGQIEIPPHQQGEEIAVTP
jgi:hypothetical protein